MNKTYLASIRSESCYPTFRAFVTIATILAYIVAAIAVGAGVVSNQPSGLAIGCVIGVVIVLIAKVGQEVSLMIADIADATIDSAGRRNEAPESPRNLRADPASTQPASRPTAKPAAPGPTIDISEAPTGPMGVCPNCESVIPLASQNCKKCRASFAEGSAWKVKPLRA